MIQGDMKYNVSNRIVWLGGQLVHVDDAKINVLSPTAQYGLNVFEGIPCYWNEEKRKLFAFRLDDHFNRLERSIKLLQLDSPYSKKILKKAFIDTVKANEYTEDIIVRQTVFGDGYGSWVSSEAVNMFISPIPRTKSNSEYNKKGLKCCISSWHRISESTISPRIKCGANYINSRMAQKEALRNGYDTAIFLNVSGKVCEGPGSCLFMVKNKELITPQLTDSVLESITRDSIICIAKELNIKVIERSIDRTELYTANEAFLCGSSMGITPICSIDGYSITDNYIGELTDAVRTRYMNITRGNEDRYYSWLTEV